MTHEELLQRLREEVVRRGYTIELDVTTGTEKVIRPDGTVAVIAKRKAVE